MTLAAVMQIDVGYAPGQGSGGAIGIREGSGAIATREGFGAAGTDTAARAQQIGPVGLDGNSTSAGIAAPASFRSNWQQMVAALGDSADEHLSPAAVVNGPQTAETNDRVIPFLLNAKPGSAETESHPPTTTAEPTNLPAAQASATLSHAVVNGSHETAPDEQEVSASRATLVAGHPGHAKPADVDRHATAKSNPLRPDSQSINDAAATMVALFFAPAPLVIASKTPVSSPSLVPATYPASEHADAHPAIPVASRGPRALFPTATIDAPKAESSVQDAGVRSTWAPGSDAEESPASGAGIGSHSLEAIVEHAAVSVAAATTSQPVASPKNVDGAIPTVPPTPSAVESGELSWLSSQFDVEALRPQIAAARSVAAPQSLRLNRAADTQLSSAALQGTNSQPDGATAGSAVIRDAASATTSIPGRETLAQIVSERPTAETFAALDGAGSSMQSTWIHAGPHQAEAGFEDPSLGWVSVRAGSTSGGISAVVLPSSADATQALGAHMAGLHDYLREQHSPVESLTLASVQSSAADAGSQQGMQHEGQQQMNQGNPANPQALNAITSARNITSPSQTTQFQSENPELFSSSGGRYISVMA